MTGTVAHSAGTRRVVVVGGGISGLVTARELCRAGHEVRLLEATHRVGGAMRSILRDGFVVETGPSTVIGTPEIRRLVTDLDLDGELLEADSRLPRYVYTAGRLRRVPLGPLSFLTTDLLSLRAKARALREPWVPARSGEEDESVEAFIVRRFGREIHDVLVAPMVAGIYAGNTARLGVASVFPSLPRLEHEYGSVLRGALRGGASGGHQPARSKRTLISFRRGLETLPRRLVDATGELRVETGTVVTDVRGAGESGYRLEAVRSGGERWALDADAVVLALPAEEAGRVLASVHAGVAPDLTSVECPPLIVASVALPREAVPGIAGGFGFLVPPSEDVRILGCLWTSSIFPRGVPEGWAQFTLFLGGATDPAVLELGDKAVAELLHADLSRTMGIAVRPKVLSLWRHTRAIPQYGLGHGARTERVRALVAENPGLFVTGNFLEGVSVGDCVSGAVKTARSVNDYLEKSSPSGLTSSRVRSTLT